MLDIIIKNGFIIDGSGSPAFPSDLGIKDGKIVMLGSPIHEPAQKEIDATGKYVTPGFIDIHRHADANLFLDNFGALELRQGLTTIINGNCGLSIVPAPAKYRDEIFDFLQPVIGEVDESQKFHTFAEYIERVAARPLPLNVGMNIGNGTIRAASKGYEIGPLSQEELKTAQAYLRSSLEAGAMAVTLGIVYAPEYCYDMEGFIQVLQPMKDFDVPLVTHIRGEGDLFHESLREVIEIAKRLGVRLHISHLKCIGKRNWGHGIREALAILDEARRGGMSITCDVYPYTAGSTQLIQILPPQYLEGGTSEIVKRLKDPKKRRELTEILKYPQAYFENLVSSIGWENIITSTLNLEKNQKYSGKSILEIANLQNKDPYECAYDLLVEEACRISMVDYIVCEEDLRTILNYPYSAVISDSTYPSKGLPHPRVYGTYGRILSKYVRDEKVLTLPEAIYKISHLPAKVYGLKEKGLLKVGTDADINIFDLDHIEAQADYDNPKQFTTGFDYVLVNGEIAVENDHLTHMPCGKLLVR